MVSLWHIMIQIFKKNLSPKCREFGEDSMLAMFKQKRNTMIFLLVTFRKNEGGLIAKKLGWDINRSINLWIFVQDAYFT